jgi:cleavage and polyadenylation specificity factor subunit 1
MSKPVYVAEALTSTPPFLSANFTGRRAAAKEVLTEILVADLGDVVAKTPYLIVSITGCHWMTIANFI